MAGGRGGFWILGKISPSGLSGVGGLLENAGFIPGRKGSLSAGASDQSRAGLVLLSMEGAGNFGVLWFLFLLGSPWLDWDGGGT